LHVKRRTSKRILPPQAKLSLFPNRRVANAAPLESLGRDFRHSSNIHALRGSKHGISAARPDRHPRFRSLSRRRSRANAVTKTTLLRPSANEMDTSDSRLAIFFAGSRDPDISTIVAYFESRSLSNCVNLRELLFEKSILNHADDRRVIFSQIVAASVAERVLRAKTDRLTPAKVCSSLL